MIDIRDDLAAAKTPAEVWNWISCYTGIEIPYQKVCREHQPPWEWFRTLWFDEPDIVLLHGPRGGGKSFQSGLHTHMRSRALSRHGTRILGGSKQQAAQIYAALQQIIRPEMGPDELAHFEEDQIVDLLAERAVYRNGSIVSMLAASPKAVRGPHVPDLKLDEIDEMKPSIFEAAVGMATEDLRRGRKSTISMTSTWHNSGGVMGEQIKRGEAGEIPFYRFCLFEVLERCPEERSGPNLEKCGECPLQPWCHEDIHETGLPKAKRSNGHYTIRSAVQKTRALSPAAFESDFLCRGPKVEGRIFPRFSQHNVTIEAAYDPRLPTFVAIDTGSYCGIVFFQVKTTKFHDGTVSAEVNVFGEMLLKDYPPDGVGDRILEVVGNRPVTRIFMDPAGDAKTGTGVVIGSVIERKLRHLCRVERWGKFPIRDTLVLLDGLIQSADGTRHLKVHPDCKRTIESLTGYMRDFKSNQWLDDPADPQHPFEDIVDPLRCGLRMVIDPDVYRGKSDTVSVHPSSLF